MVGVDADEIVTTQVPSRAVTVLRWSGDGPAVGVGVSGCEVAVVGERVAEGCKCGSPQIVEGFPMRLPGRGPRCSRS